MRVQITENLDIDLHTEMWCCTRCNNEIMHGTKNYKEGCIIQARDPNTVYQSVVNDYSYSFSPDVNWCKIVEFYCPTCGLMIENEILPLGHPITFDIELNIKKLKEKYNYCED